MKAPRNYKHFSYVKLPVTAITTIILGAGVLELSAQTPTDQTELRADPANDYFSRINQLYKAASASKDYHEKDRLYNRIVPMLKDYLKHLGTI